VIPVSVDRPAGEKLDGSPQATFKYTFPVRFAHCDPAGIGYFPRLLEMLDGAVEDFMAEVTGADRAQTHLRERLGIPTIDLQVNFGQPCRLGELLTLAVTPVKLGRTSLTLQTQVTCNGEPRFSARQTVVQINVDTGRPYPWAEVTRLLPIFAAVAAVPST
jgi:4-hydroxybenzoyl-CoA thioesterase